MPKKTPPFPEYPSWTTSKFFSFIRSGLRAKWTRQKFEYLCAECGEYYPQKEVEVDHIISCGTLKTYDDIGPFVERLFVGKDKLRLLCKPCHKAITKKERERKKNEDSDTRE